MKRMIYVFVALVAALLCGTTPMKASIDGTAPVVGENYYLFNVYQAKFLSYGNSYGTQASLAPMGDSSILLCTLESAGSNKVKINTHFSLTYLTGVISVNNYLFWFEDDNMTYVNSNWGNSDAEILGSREPTTFTINQTDEGYYLTNETLGNLMFDKGSACNIALRGSSTLMADKSLWRFVSEDEYNALLAKKRFTAAAMNVDGMPKSLSVYGVYNIDLNPDAKESAGATAIGQKLVNMGYDFVGVSEDFNYNNEILAQINSTYNAGTHRGKLESYAGIVTKYLAQSTLFDTDGLNFFWKKTLNATNESWTAWNTHYGYTDNGADGLIEKGYRYYLVTLADGTEIDVYILHMDAEDSDGDNSARASQLTQLANAIKATDNGRPIIVMGDTNCRYTRDVLKASFINAINADERFTIKDAWVEYGRKGIYPTGTSALMWTDLGYRKAEVVDKVFYINNTASNIRIVAETYTQDLSFINDEGEPLADHWPCVVTFSYHDYDPAIDDEDTDNMKNVYLRNRKTGAFLKAGGTSGTHATQGEYGKALNFTKASDDNKYLIESEMGFLSQSTDPYLNGATPDEWTVTKDQEGYYVITYKSGGSTKALTGNDKRTFPYGPNTRYVKCETYSSRSQYQQWEMLTAEDLMMEMLTQASQDNPYNCTFLLRGANFDPEDPYAAPTDLGGKWNVSITSDATAMSYMLGTSSTNPTSGDGGKINWDYGNYVAEVYNSSYSGLSSKATTWEVAQTITGLPNGLYKVTCQGFYRDGELDANNPGTIHSYLYARTDGDEARTQLQSMYAANCTENYSSTTDANGYYVPNSMSDASVFFSYGYYPNEVSVNVVGNTLTVLVGKPEETKSTSGWTCFDNFQIYYLGTPIETGTEGYLYNVDAGAFLNHSDVWDGEWYTRIVLSNEGRKWTAEETSGKYKLHCADQADGIYLGATDNLSAWVDRTDTSETEFYLSQDADNYYTIQNAANNGILCWTGEKDYHYFVAPTLSSNDQEQRGGRWMFLNDTQYAQIQPNASAQREARMSAWPVIRSARNTVCAMDFTAQETLWKNSALTGTQPTTIADQIKEILMNALDAATAEAPIDLSYYIKNADCSADVNTDWTNNGFENHISYYAAANNNGPSLGANFIERWVGWGNALPNSELYQTISELPNGKYLLGVDIRASVWDGNPANGLELYAQVGSQEEETYTCALATEQNTYVQVPFQVTTSGDDIKIGVRVNNTGNVNWVAFDNFRLLYLSSDTSDGIERLKAETGHADKTGIYDLTGRRVKNPTKGIYIINGKKIIK